MNIMRIRDSKIGWSKQRREK